MSSTGAPTPHRAGLTAISEATARLKAAVRDHRSWSRERRAAHDFFHNELALRPGDTVQDVLTAITKLRGRKVSDLALPGLPPHVTGIVVPGEEEDYIGLSDRLTARHRAHVLLHEVRHLSPDSTVGEVALHGHFDGVTLQQLKEQIAFLPLRIQEEILTRPARLRAGYDPTDPLDEERKCEVFARVVLPLLDLDPTSQATGSLTTSFSNRRSI